MPNYTKLFNSIVTSTIWTEDDKTRIVWITMLAMSDQNGEVHASVPGLARVSGVSLYDCESALVKLSSPDAYSRTPDNEGRRISPIDGGWELLNHRKYRAMASKTDSQNANAERQKRHRERNAKVTPRNATVTPSNGSVTQSRDIAEAEAEAESCLTESASPISVENVLNLEPETPKAKKPKPEPPDPRREEFVSIFREYIEAGGVTYDRPNAADNAQLKTLLKRKPEMTAEEWRDYLLYIHENSRGQFAPVLLKDCGSLALVCSKIDRIQIYKDREETK